MLKLALRPFAYLAFNANRWPIQAIAIISLLASTAYFSILDLSIPDHAGPSSSITSFYHSGTDVSSNGSGWIEIDQYDISSFPNATKYIATQAIFSGTNKSGKDNLPDLPESYPGKTDFERVIVLPQDQFDSWLTSISELPAGSTNREVWRLRPFFSWTGWARWSVRRIIDLIHETDAFDLAVVFTAYVGMHYTFISLFLAMRRLGSSVLLASAVLLSSLIAFMFAFVTSHFLGVRIPLKSLSEGLPFLVITVGFESKVTIASLILRYSQEHRTSSSYDAIKHALFSSEHNVFRDYFIEIVALIAASFSGVNGLWQFCFLSAWILIYDCLMLFTFFVSILSVRVEMMKIKQNEAIREALEDDGVSADVAKKVVQDDERRKKLNHSKNEVILRTGYIFKSCIIIGVLLNAFQLTNFPFNMTGWTLDRAINSSGSLSLTDTMNFNDFNLPIDKDVIVTILPNLVFERSRFSARFEDWVMSFLSLWTKIVGDPIISKFIVLALSISLVLNGVLIKVARSGANVRVVEKKVPVIVERKTPTPSESEDESDETSSLEIKPTILSKMRPLDDLVAVMKGGFTSELTDEEVIRLGVSGKLPLYALEKHLKDTTRAVFARRAIVSRLSDTKTLESSALPYAHYDYDRVLGACCENVIGYMPLPVGVAGPLVIDGKPYFIPMATTEGCLVASTMRGCKALNGGGGVITVLTQDSMARGPCLSFGSLAQAGAAKVWLDSDEGQKSMKKAFESTSRFAKLLRLKTAMAGSLLYVRFCTSTGDAMGMNMVTKGVEHALKHMAENCGFDDMEIVSVSGNYCVDKKPAAINWLDGRGKSVVAEATVPGHLVRSVLKSDVDALVELNISKNLIGSAMAGSIGGFNAQASNLVSAIFLACGQDPAQNIESSNCITLMKRVGDDLQISVSMPSIEVGTVGGGTILGPQAAVLEMLGLKGPHPTSPGDNARQLARIVASGVLAAELSLCAALAAGHLVQSHMQHNRSKASTPAVSVQDIGRLREGSEICMKG